MIGIVLAYFVAAVSPNMDVANAVLPVYVTINLFFGGFLFDFNTIPRYWKWRVLDPPPVPSQREGRVWLVSSHMGGVCVASGRWFLVPVASPHGVACSARPDAAGTRTSTSCATRGAR